MKLIEKLAQEFNEQITSHYLHGGEGELPDTVEKVWMAGFCKARKMACELEKEYSLLDRLGEHLSDMGEQEMSANSAKESSE